ncbi:MAG: hypothetical protein RR404_03740 [Bacilli bacterium]
MINTEVKETQKILDICPNYDLITKFKIPKGDMISNQIRNDYVDFVVDKSVRNENLDQIRRYDQMMGDYIQRGKFYKVVQKLYGKPLFEDGLECIITEFYELLDIVYMTYEKERPIEPKKGTRWL